MRVKTCYFCSSSIYPGYGITFARNDGCIFDMCSSRCRKYFAKKLNPRKFKWTKAARIARGKETASRFVRNFESRLEKPVIYSRALCEQTRSVIDKVEEIRRRRVEHEITARTNLRSRIATETFLKNRFLDEKKTRWLPHMQHVDRRKLEILRNIIDARAQHIDNAQHAARVADVSISADVVVHAAQTEQQEDAERPSEAQFETQQQ